MKRKTKGKRLAAKLKSIAAELRKRMHEPIAELGKWLRQVVQGYFNYHAVPGNFPRLAAFRREVARHLGHTLRRRSQRSRWTHRRLEQFLDRYLPRPQILHPYPLARFGASHPR
jgi:hypothetical protein